LESSFRSWVDSMVNLVMAFDANLEDRFLHVYYSAIAHCKEEVSLSLIVDQSVNLHKIKKFPYRVISTPKVSLRGVSVKSPMQYARYYAPLLFDCERMLYIDNDVLFLGDISVFFHADLEGNAFGAVQNLFQKTVNETFFYQGVACQKYKNTPSFLSGQILFDMKKAVPYMEKIIKMGVKGMGDMAAFSIACEGEIKEFDKRYSVPAKHVDLNLLGRGLLKGQDFSDAVILHAHGKPKMWDARSDWHSLYKTYL